ncbi:MAG: NAD(P)-dependent glycerol-1-phosphate dehydrogenase, partial [Halovenus sp.]
MFEKSKWIRLPRSVVVGHGVLAQTADVVSRSHLTGQPLVVTSPTPKKVAGDQVVDQLAQIGPEPEVVVVEKASFDAIEKVRNR